MYGGVGFVFGEPRTPPNIHIQWLSNTLMCNKYRQLAQAVYLYTHTHMWEEVQALCVFLDAGLLCLLFAVW
jgi:hypothetical protein